MVIIGSNRIEAIDWLQEQLGNTSRPHAERAYRAMRSEGIVMEGTEVAMHHMIPVDDLHKIAMNAQIDSNNNRAQMSRRRHVNTENKNQKKQRNRLILKQGNMIDCAEDDIYK